MSVTVRARKRRNSRIRKTFASGLAALGALTVTAGFVVAVQSPASAISDPGGNNGTVKVGDTALDNSGSNANDPKIGCPLTISWYDFALPDGKSKTDATVTFELQSPTSGGTTATPSPAVTPRPPSSPSWDRGSITPRPTLWLSPARPRRTGTT